MIVTTDDIVDEFVKGSKEKYGINPVNNVTGLPVVPDKVALLKVGADTDSATFGAPTTLAGYTSAVMVQGLTPGTYGIVCALNVQGDGQQPIWILGGRFRVIGRLS